MPSRQRLFRVLYRLGFTPWDGHPLSPTLRELVEGTAALATSTALDIGCGTGDNAIYLAKHGWQVTGVDYVDKPLEEARKKAATADVSVDFVKADATRLSSERHRVRVRADRRQRVPARHERRATATLTPARSPPSPPPTAGS